MGHGVAERHTPAIAASNGEASGQGLGAKLFGGNPAASAGGSQNPKGQGPCARQGRSPLGSDHRMPGAQSEAEKQAEVPGNNSAPFVLTLRNKYAPHMPQNGPQKGSWKRTSFLTRTRRPVSCGKFYGYKRVPFLRKDSAEVVDLYFLRERRCGHRVHNLIGRLLYHRKGIVKALSQFSREAIEENCADAAI